MNRNKTQELVLISMLIAVELVLMFTPLGYIPLGVIRATTLHIPVILAGILLGYKGGILLGLTFGFTSLLINTITPTITSFVFSPFYSIGNVSGNFNSVLIALVPRIMLGVVSAFVYQHLQHKTKPSIAVIAASILGTFTNTILVLSGIYVFFGSSYAAARNLPYDTLLKVLLGIITTNGVLEASLAAVIVLALSKLLKNPRKG